MRLLSPKANKVLFVLIAVAIFMVLSFAMSSVFGMKNYDILLEADTMNIYSEGILIGTVSRPKDIMDTYNGTIGVGVIDFSQLGIEKSNLLELYRFEFIKDNKIISTIRMFTPESENDIDTHSLGVWRKYNGTYVVMHESGYYFTFGELFFDNLSKILS